MKLKLHSTQRGDISLLDLFAILIAVGIVVTVGYAYVTNQRANSMAKRIRCVSHLKQIGLSFRIWGADNSDRYPMALSVTIGGTLEVSNLIWRTYQCLSNELGTPLILTCPADSRQPAASFQSLANTNIGYFIGLDADETMPQLLLAGDYAVAAPRAPVNRVLTIQTNDSVVWSDTPHQRRGNIALADGSVRQYTKATMREAVKIALQDNWVANTNATLRLALPE